ncbi:hypothetical protein GCM10027515_14570 [Schumannella luteola]|uniref:Type IV secretion protein Rhs n=1 Tax=Schumannella luteola TaxID=472059 RepID=A0A852Y6H9_9MICO|nr:hypothetical protein [Schumannella luteola]NYG97903.1 hypothetical protein [Schumannella luteola]TPX03046.1 hypothetical protein FJ656_19070 [Schumannella luteola]
MAKGKRWWDRLNKALYPYLGPAQLGPGRGGERTDAPPPAMCPLCGQAMATHEIERSTDGHTPTRLHCPTPSASSASSAA